MASSTRPSRLSADKVIAPAEAIVNALEEKRRMIEIERTDPQSVRCSRSEPAQGNLLHKGASQNGAVSACVMHGAVLGCEPTRWSQPTRSCWPKQVGSLETRCGDSPQQYTQKRARKHK